MSLILMQPQCSSKSIAPFCEGSFLTNTPPKFNIDTRNNNFWTEIQFPNHDFWYLVPIEFRRWKLVMHGDSLVMLKRNPTCFVPLEVSVMKKVQKWCFDPVTRWASDLFYDLESYPLDLTIKHVTKMYQKLHLINIYGCKSFPESWACVMHV